MKINVHREPDWEVFTGSNCRLSPDEIHLFRINVEDQYPHIAADYSNVFSAQELDRASRFFHEKDRVSYLVRRYYRRKILSCFMSCFPQALVFSTTGNKKPAINGVEFNVSHSGSFVVIAVSSSPVGIDLEYINPLFDYTSIVASCFNPQERHFVGTESAGFFTLWTRKEAILKATAEGLTDDLTQISCLDDEVTRHGTLYQLKTIGFNKQYVLSLATMKSHADYRYWEI